MLAVDVKSKIFQLHAVATANDGLVADNLDGIVFDRRAILVECSLHIIVDDDDIWRRGGSILCQILTSGDVDYFSSHTARSALAPQVAVVGKAYEAGLSASVKRGSCADAECKKSLIDWIHDDGI